MRKKDVAKELKRLGFDDMEPWLAEGPKRPKNPEGTYHKTGSGLTLTRDKRVDLEESVQSGKNLNPIVPKQSMHTIEQLILDDPPRNRTVEEVIEAITVYCLDGTYSAVAKKTGISYSTISYWHQNKSWFNEVVNYIKALSDHKLEARMMEIVDASTTELLERITGGNVGVHQGKVVMVEDEEGNPTPSKIPLSAMDLGRIGAIFTDKRQILRGMALQKGDVAPQSVEDKLDLIARALIDVSKNMPRGKTIDAKRVD